MRPVNNMIEFKQIIGRGTRLFEDKFYFTVVDFVGAYVNFADPEWDGDPEPEDPPKKRTIDIETDGEDGGGDGGDKPTPDPKENSN